MAMYFAIPSELLQIASGLAVTVVARNEVVPCDAIILETACKASSVASITSRPPAPWMCTSTNPGVAIRPVACTSVAPAGSDTPLRGPTDSITPSRVTIAAS